MADAPVPPIPHVTGDLVRIQRSSGFSPQEAWGRWSVGQRTEVVVDVRADRHLQLAYQGNLFQAGQRLTVSVDGRVLQTFAYANAGGAAPFGARSRLHLSPGQHVVAFTVNRSSRSPGPVTFAPDDPRDLGAAFTTLRFSADAPRTPANPADLLGDPQTTGLLFTGPGQIFRAVSGEGLRVPVPSGEGLHLEYSVVPARAGHPFHILVDGQPLTRVTVPAGRTLLKGRVPLPSLPDDRPHAVTIVAAAGPPNHTADYLLAQSAVRPEQVSFYVDEIRVSRPPGATRFVGQALALLVAVGTVLLFRRLLG
ncbi:hypothetical protein [uncultured Deinococcus sp.]|uniref:hypothetical protein n=1 Tax=uncultured Deinococcus sp. TaxID=158789 RepID=UPI0025ED5F8F|nr:hypothetical protein [uncultured Deinococcus sp.]